MFLKVDFTKKTSPIRKVFYPALITCSLPGHDMLWLQALGLLVSLQTDCAGTPVRGLKSASVPLSSIKRSVVHLVSPDVGPEIYLSKGFLGWVLTDRSSPYKAMGVPGHPTSTVFWDSEQRGES